MPFLKEREMQYLLNLIVKITQMHHNYDFD